MTTTPLSVREKALRALSRVTRDQETGCLISATLDRKGRAVVRYQMDGQTIRVLAHRAVYAALHQPLKPYQALRRRCGDLRCVEPTHFTLTS
ncbi:hypothetical protein GCM10009759_77850 [Kitasatospora saccharophila]|uniref:HNH endonuclease n=1 Tax=Kitasatospora saccharophila TaxID=407973 RepID=A0ABN2YDY2_9ACTN